MGEPYLLRATDIIGEIVSNAVGEPLGFVEDLMIDLDTGKVSYIAVARGGLLGLGAKLFAIPMELLNADPFGKGFILDIDMGAFDAARSFDKDNWPDSVRPL